MRLGMIFLTAANAVLPIVLLILLGYILKRVGFLTKEFIKVGNKFVFRVCLSCSLFINVYNIQSFAAIQWDFILFCVVSAFVLFALGLVICVVSTNVTQRRGVILQAVFRGNFAIVGIPLAGALGGDAAVELASVVAAFMLPLWNALGVVALSLFSDKKQSFKENTLRIIRSVAKNPMILGAFFGLVCLLLRELQLFAFGKLLFSIQRDVKFLYTAANNLKVLSSPMALIVMGAQFEFSAVKGMFKEVSVCTLGRIVLAPALGIGAAYLLSTHTSLLSCGVNEYPSLIGLLGSPAAVSGAIMAGEMGNDEQLATQTVVWTSIGSILTVFLLACLLMAAGLLTV